jgi:hypothetical protein
LIAGAAVVNLRTLQASGRIRQEISGIARKACFGNLATRTAVSNI